MHIVYVHTPLTHGHFYFMQNCLLNICRLLLRSTTDGYIFYFSYSIGGEGLRLTFLDACIDERQ
jgi:hypothetical protein